MLKKLEISGVTCDICGKEKAFIGSEAYMFTKIRQSELVPAKNENEKYSEIGTKDLFMCSGCSAKLRQYIEDMKQNASKEASGSKKIIVNVNGGASF